MIVTLKVGSVEINEVKISDVCIEACYSTEEFEAMIEVYLEKLPELLKSLV